MTLNVPFATKLHEVNITKDIKQPKNIYREKEKRKNVQKSIGPPQSRIPKKIQETIARRNEVVTFSIPLQEKMKNINKPKAALTKQKSNHHYTIMVTIVKYT